MADRNEIDRILAENYGQGFTSPALNSGDGEIASTPDFLTQYGANERMSSGIPGFLRRIGAGLRSLAPSQVTTPVNTLTGREPNLRTREDHANPLMLMGGEGADTMASWVDMHPGVDRGQSRPQDLLAPLGLSALGMPFAASGAVGVFGGRLARTADQGALRRAEGMATSGADRLAIWDQTGWFKGVDGKWRFEIDDSQARLTPRAQEAFRSPSDRPLHSVLPEVMEHHELYRAYPDLAYTGVTARRSGVGPGGGSYAHDVDRMEAVAPNPEQGLSIILHEGTHGLSNRTREGFAPGAELYDFQNPYSPVFHYRRPDESAYDAYRRTAGEVEARNVQARQSMTPEERRNRPPWETQDVPDADQILRQYSAGPQMSVPDTKGAPRLNADQVARMQSEIAANPNLEDVIRASYLADGSGPAPRTLVAGRSGEPQPSTVSSVFPNQTREPRHAYRPPEPPPVTEWRLSPERLNELEGLYRRGADRREMLDSMNSTVGRHEASLDDAKLTQIIDLLADAQRNRGGRQVPPESRRTFLGVLSDGYNRRQSTKGGDAPERPVGPTVDEVLRQYSQGPQMSAPQTKASTLRRSPDLPEVWRDAHPSTSIAGRTVGERVGRPATAYGDDVFVSPTIHGAERQEPIDKIGLGRIDQLTRDHRVEDGWLTTTGRFLDRPESYQLAETTLGPAAGPVNRARSRIPGEPGLESIALRERLFEAWQKAKAEGDTTAMATLANQYRELAW